MPLRRSLPPLVPPSSSSSSPRPWPCSRSSRCIFRFLRVRSPLPRPRPLSSPRCPSAASLYSSSPSPLARTTLLYFSFRPLYLPTRSLHVHSSRYNVRLSVASRVRIRSIRAFVPLLVTFPFPLPPSGYFQSILVGRDERFSATTSGIAHRLTVFTLNSLYIHRFFSFHKKIHVSCFTNT